MPLVPVSGSANGTSVAQGTLGGFLRNVAGSSLGSGILLATLFRGLLLGGATHGFGSTQLRDVTASGTAFGSGVVSATDQFLKGARGAIWGHSKLFLSEPRPLQGHTTLSAYMEVFKVLPPVCLTAPPPALRYGQLIQRGDLAIWLRRVGGFAISPYRVRYALYQQLPGGSFALVGPKQRVPVQGDVGEYYASGIAGKGGQPGLWKIVWCYQESYGSPIYTESMEFSVQDDLAAGVPDPDRICKKGWF